MKGKEEIMKSSGDSFGLNEGYSLESSIRLLLEVLIDIRDTLSKIEGKLGR